MFEIVKNNKIGLVIYGSLYKNEGVLSNCLLNDIYDGPKLKISFRGCNPFKENLTRVLDYEKGDYIKTKIKIFDSQYGLEQIKRYIALREGNINYVTLYKSKNDEIINLPIHLYDYKNNIINDLKPICKKLKLDYLFFITYPSKVDDTINYVKKSNKKLKESKKYLCMCDLKTLTSDEKHIFNFK